MKKKEEPKYKYPLKSFRISEEVYEEMKKQKEETETWNMYFKRVINKRK